jgi:hypothetical protein
MQTKKRAKSVHFGKKKESTSDNQEERSENEIIETKTNTEDDKQIVSNQPDKSTISVETITNIGPKEEEDLKNVTPEVEVRVEPEVSETKINTQAEGYKNTPPQVKENIENYAEKRIESIQEILQPVDIRAEAQTKNELDQPEINEMTQKEDNDVQTLGGDTYIVEREYRKSMIGYFLLVAVVSFVVGLISMGAATYFLPKTDMFAGISLLVSSPTATPIPKPTITPSPTPKPLNPAKYKVSILNGTNVSGAASKLKNTLVTEGFNIAKIGNADAVDYTETVISFKKEVEPEYIVKLREELEKEFVVAEKNGTLSEANKDADVIITIGIETPE